MSPTRRDVLRGAGAALAAGALPACGPGTAPEPGRIEHIVICMMENRSFDHVFSGYTLDEGRTDIDAMTPSMASLASDGSAISPRLVESPCVHPDPPHGWNSSRDCFAAGTNAGFVTAYEASTGATAGERDQVMRYLDRSWQPITYALADRYALCQRWYSSVLTSTWPNRIFFHSGQSQGMKTNTQPEGGPFTCRTIWDQLDEAGIDWRYFWSDLPTLSLWGSHFQGHLSPIEEFFTACRLGTLPPVTCVDAATLLNDDHPPNHPLMGQLFIGSVYNALAASPVWDRCLFVLCYDEAGGFHDHVVPPTIEDDRAADGFDQLGFRVPGLVCGPFVQNLVSNTSFEHTSVLKEIQRWMGIDEALTLRNEVTNDLSDLLDEDRLAENAPAAPAELPVVTLSEEEILAQCTSDRARRSGKRPGQPELEDALHAMGLGHMDRTAELDRLRRFFLDTAESLGVATVV